MRAMKWGEMDWVERGGNRRWFRENAVVELAVFKSSRVGGVGDDGRLRMAGVAVGGRDGGEWQGVRRNSSGMQEMA